MATHGEPSTCDPLVSTIATFLGSLYNDIVSTISASLGIDNLISELVSVKKTMASLKYTLEETTARRGLDLSQLQSQPYRSQPFQLYTGQRFAPRRHASEPDLKTATARNFTPIEPFNITVIAHKANGPDYYSARAQYDTQSDFNLVSERLVKRLLMMQHRQAVSGDRWCSGFEGEPVQLTHRIKLSWHVSSDMKTRDDVFFVAPNASFDVLFGRNFIYSHGDLASAVPKVLAITSYESRAQARQRAAEEEQVRLAKIAEGLRREQEILGGPHHSFDEDQRPAPADLTLSNEAVSQAGTWTSSSNTLSGRPARIDSSLILRTPASRVSNHATSIPMSRENSGHASQLPEFDASAGAAQNSIADDHHPSYLSSWGADFPVPSHEGRRLPTHDDSTVMSSAVKSHHLSTDDQSHISQDNTEITRPSTGLDGRSEADHSGSEDHDQAQDIGSLDDRQGTLASSQPYTIPQTLTTAAIGNTNAVRERPTSRRTRMMKRFGFSARARASAGEAVHA
ncbi:hypothetical protein K431DRAFT_304765 [Polychaeton citri CBS 116435]|uniref:Uncharacterized protein n=1 Tax=Polychaeton citri CBS 116435 TaxID=1314669 RepID=A0A9P4UMT4_9PEZI|nr:hypothetical protein K431DRAFT_304765 [Polychaeton citri CBS 116435]